MAHVAKVKSSGVGPMVGHYAREAERRGYERDNIDPSRMGDNYAVGAPDADTLAARVRERVSEAVRSHEKASGKALRKDANVLMDWVVTCPQDCPESLRGRFFETVVSFIQRRYGAENVPGGFVHMDEATPHVHVPVVPERDGKLVASKVINRADLKTFHGDLGKAVDEALGMHVSIELSEERQGEKQLSRLDQREYRAAKDELAAAQERAEQEQRRLECLQREIEEVQPAAVTLGESIKALVSGRGDGARERELEDEKSRLAAGIADLERQVGEARGRAVELEAGNSGLRDELVRVRGRYQQLEQRFRVLERGVREVIDRLREVPNVVSEWAQDIARELGKRVYDPVSPERLWDAAHESAAMSVQRRVSRGIERDKGMSL